MLSRSSCVSHASSGGEELNHDHHALRDSNDLQWHLVQVRSPVVSSKESVTNPTRSRSLDYAVSASGLRVLPALYPKRQIFWSRACAHVLITRTIHATCWRSSNLTFAYRSFVWRVNLHQRFMFMLYMSSSWPNLAIGSSHRPRLHAQPVYFGGRS